MLTTRRLIMITLLMSGWLSGVIKAADSLGVTSPNGKLQFSFFIQTGGSPTYTITYQQKLVIDRSALGILRNSNGDSSSADWNSALRVLKTETRSQDTIWKPIYSERSAIVDQFNELIISLGKPDPKLPTMQVIVRVYDAGVAFRYFFPEDMRAQILEFDQEATQFRLPADSEAFFTDHAQGNYSRRPISGWKKGAELPLTLTLKNGLWVSILQAEQTNYPRMRLYTEADGTLVSRLFGGVTEASPFATPWRVVMVVEKPTKLLENNDIVLNLNPANQLTETGWIRPGRVMREITLSTEGAKKVVDFAVDQNIDFIHFDAGWYGHEYEIASDAAKVDVDPRRNPKKDLNLPEAIRYATSKGKGVILYVNHRALERQLDTLLPLYRRWGVAGIKFGFVQTGSHRWTVWLHEAVKKAAQYQLMVNIHDEYSPTGFSRTFPNLMTQEGIRGNEEFPDATHNTILPFTRFLAGAADYTYCFNDKRLKNTKGHQLALSIINYSPWQYLYWYDKPESYTSRADIELWKFLPTTWDDTRVLEGLPGEYISVARRKGDEWYVGCVTNNDARNRTLSLHFLPDNKEYHGDLYEDNGQGKVRKRTLILTRQTVLPLTLLSKGGVAIRLYPARRSAPH